jgi:tetratricopeptide (TPR) repeat protein
LGDAYLKIGQELTESKDYDNAIRILMKMLKVCWYQQDVKKELKVYEKLALSYFYKQDIESCKKYLDRSLRGKFEGPNSSSKRVAMQ